MTKKIIVGFILFLIYFIPSVYFSLNSECDPNEVGDVCCNTVFNHKIDNFVFVAIPFAILSAFFFFYNLNKYQNFFKVSILSFIFSSILSGYISGFLIWDFFRGCSYFDDSHFFVYFLCHCFIIILLLLFSFCAGLIQGSMLYFLQSRKILLREDLINK